MKPYTLILSLLPVVAGIFTASASATLEVDVSPQKYAARPGEVFPVDYVVSWEGALDAYTVMPPTLPVLDWGAATVLEIRAHSRGDRHETRLTVGYSAETAGTYTAPALTIRVLEWDADAASHAALVEDAASMPAKVVEAASVTVVFRDPRFVVWAALVLVALAVAGAFGWAALRKRRRTVSEEAGQSPVEKAQALLHEARRHRLDADYYAFYRALCSAVACIETDAPDSRAALLDKLKRAADDAGYRGVRPSDDALEGDFKDVERIIAQEIQRASKET